MCSSSRGNADSGGMSGLPAAVAQVAHAALSSPLSTALQRRRRRRRCFRLETRPSPRRRVGRWRPLNPSVRGRDRFCDEARIRGAGGEERRTGRPNDRARATALPDGKSARTTPFVGSLRLPARASPGNASGGGAAIGPSS